MNVTDLLERALAAARDHNLSARDAHVLLALASHANVQSGGWAWPGRETLAADVRRGRTSVDLALIELRRLGLIEHKPAAPGRVASYRIVTSPLVPSAGTADGDVTSPPVTSDENVTSVPVTSSPTRPERDRNVTSPLVTEQGTENREPP